LNKILFLLCLVYAPYAHASEGRFTLVPQGGIAPFEATCFDAEATAKLLTWKEFLKQEEQKLCEFEKRTLVLDSELVIENMQITLDETRARTQIEIETRDKELEELRNIIKKNKKLNIPVVIASAAAIGFGVGFGTYHIASK
tara:strand:- start:2138 stop:2563 length:426 start_codon:yes stop_codon:yes gene_type:complete